MAGDQKNWVEKIGSAVGDTLKDNPIFNVLKEASGPPRPVTSQGPTGVFGFPENRTDVSPEYLVQIRSDMMDRTINALLQDNFVTSIQSTWRQSSLTGSVQGLLQEGAQALSGYALGSQFMTRRIWYGSSPMRLNLKLKFEAIKDAQKEVVVPCGTLQQIAAPGLFFSTQQQRKILKEQPWLEYLLIVPPGPNPFYGALRSRAGKAAGEKIGSVIAFGNRPGDDISIQIGKFMTFARVIVTSAQVTWGKRFNAEGFPISASAEVQFESYEIYTKEDIATTLGYSSATTFNTFNGYDEKGGTVYRA
jgi:hypothetical protein